MSINAYPPSVRELIVRLSKLPGLGEKSATRIAMHLLQTSREDVFALADAVRAMRSRIQTCSRCFHFTDQELCAFCADPSRDTGALCVVESTADLMAIEQSGAYKGRYHVLQGVLAPLDAVGPKDIRIEEMIRRLESEHIEEVILATNPTNEGEATAHYLQKLLKDHKVRISRIAYGIPMGGDLKYIDRVTVERALRGRFDF